MPVDNALLMPVEIHWQGRLIPECRELVGVGLAHFAWRPRLRTASSNLPKANEVGVNENGIFRGSPLQAVCIIID